MTEIRLYYYRQIHSTWYEIKQCVAVDMKFTTEVVSRLTRRSRGGPSRQKMGGETQFCFIGISKKRINIVWYFASVRAPTYSTPHMSFSFPPN
jgi:hypothetical protein